jgi:predicted lipoprotein with Yx(FWY)xxD motif
MKKLFAIITLAALCMISIVSCDDDSDSESPKLEVQIANNATLGKILTDKDGKTLYFFSRDTKGNSVCSGQCVTAWPVFHSENITVGEGLVAADFTTITRPDGEKQTAYKGFPLYYFNMDANAGEINGEKANNVWYAAKPDYSLFYAQAQLVGADGKSYMANYTLANYAEGTGETPYLIDADGRTVYAFRNDKNGINNYTANAQNPAVWPIFHRDLSSLVVPSILNKADFAEITVGTAKQLTYKGWPLYYFAGNATIAGDTRGDTRGVSVGQPGLWPIVNTSTQVAPN